MPSHEFTPPNAVLYPEQLWDFELADKLMIDQAQESADIHVQTFIERLYKRSGDFEEGTDLHGRVVAALAEKEPQTAAQLQFDAGVEIATHVLGKYTNPRARIMGFLGACHEIDRIKVGLSGFDGPGIPMNSIMHYARLTINDEFDPSLKTVQAAMNVEDTLHNLYEHYPALGWFLPKIRSIMQDLGDRYRVHNTLETEAAEQVPDAEVTDPVEADAIIKSLMAHIMEQRRYGLKPAYIPASIGGSWVFYDGYQVTSEMHGKDHADKQLIPMVATIMHTTKSSFRNLQFGKSQDTPYGPGIVREVKGAFKELHPDLILHLSEGGELYIDTYGWRRLKDELGENTSLYPRIAAELVANFHDLTVPIEHVTRHGIRNITQLNPDERKQFRPINDLLVPRLKAYTNNPVPGVETSRTVREHGVVWHIRVLPMGWHASPEALENAKRVGIKLADNETFVRDHKRGLGNIVKGHKIIRRAIEESTDSVIK